MLEEVRNLIERIDEDPDELHLDYTPAVHQLIAIGEAALEPALELMLSEDEMTRLHAQRVIEGVILTMLGFVFGRGWKEGNSHENEARFRNLWSSLGDLDFEGTDEQRKHAVGLWRYWLKGKHNLSACNHHE
jgi:hypothetical protein